MSKIILTGATGGIGNAILQQLLNNQHEVFITTSSNAKLQQCNTLGMVCDFTKGSEAIAKEVVATAIDKLQGLDCLIHCAGITRDNLAIRISEQDWDDVINLNLKTAFMLSKHAIAYMSKQKQGRIIFITSVVGETGNVGQANYVASKSGLTGLAKALAIEWGSRNIFVNCVQPGFIETDMTASLNPEWKNVLLSKIPLKRMGQPSDVVDAVMFLLNTNYITGCSIRVNGGMLMN